MKELKINPRFEEFSPKKKKDDYDELEKSLLKNGYIVEKILTWHGYIIDGHNRYHICQKHNIPISDEFIEEVDFGSDATEIDAMEWMHTHHMASKELSIGEKLAMTEKLREAIREENEKKRLEGNTLGGQGGKKNNEVALQLEGNLNNISRSTWTDNQIAKKAGVGVGTVARYNKVMNSNDEDLKEKVKTGEVTVNKAYEEVRKKEARICKVCGKEKKIIDFFGNDTICKECSRKQSENNINAPQSMSSVKPSEDMKDIYSDVMTAKNAKDYINQDTELNWLKNMCDDFISQVDDRFFKLLCVIEKMDREHISVANNIFTDFVSNVFDIQEKFNNEKETN